MVALILLYPSFSFCHSLALSDRTCHVCNIVFEYPSRLRQHLQTKQHKLFDDNLNDLTYTETQTHDIQSGLQTEDVVNDEETASEPHTDYHSGRHLVQAFIFSRSMQTEFRCIFILECAKCWQCIQ